MKTVLAWIAILLLLLPAQLRADTAGEVDHLIGFTRTSEVVFIRNGHEYPPKKAAEHFQKKRAHFQNDIQTAEDFVRLAASRSILSGQPYLVRTKDGQTLPCGAWLLAELNRFRKSTQPLTNNVMEPAR
jgi:hypothetical protein